MSARSPLLGLRRFTSAITLDAGARKCGIGSRGGSTSASAARRSAGLVSASRRGEVDPHAGDDVVEHGHGVSVAAVEAHLRHHGEHDQRTDAERAPDPEERPC